MNSNSRSLAQSAKLTHPIASFITWFEHVGERAKNICPVEYNIC